MHTGVTIAALVVVVGASACSAADDTAETVTASPAATSTDLAASTSPEATTAGVSSPTESETGAIDEQVGVAPVDPPVTWEGSGLELVVDVVRIASVEELEALMEGQELRPYLDDGIETIVTFGVTLRNTTADAVDWHAGGIQTAIVLDGQQGDPLPFLGDLGGTIRGEAEQSFQMSYGSVVPVENARAAGSIRWEVGNPSGADSFERIAEVGELVIQYEVQG